MLTLHKTNFRIFFEMKNFNYYVLLLLPVLLFGVFSCKPGSKEYHYKGKVIPKNKFVQILIDLHKTDGVLMNLDVKDQNLQNPDSLSYYNYFLKKHNINYVDFQKSLDYYFSDLEQFKELYAVVIDSLKAEEHLLDSLQKFSSKKPNLWKGKQYYLIPFRDNAEDSIPFSLKNPAPGIYELAADIQVFDDDQTLGLRMLMMTKFQNDSIDSAYTEIYFKDNQYHRYIVKIAVPDTPKVTELFGYVLDYGTSIYMHLKVKRIQLIRYDFDEVPTFKTRKKTK